MLTLDGSYGEGGGQILRTALTLSVITGRPVHIERIRAGRKNPGLQPQHLTAVRAAAAICRAQLEGDEPSSQALTFIPGGPARPGEYAFDVAEAARGGSAGSAGLVLQTVLLPLASQQGESHLTIRGGTHVPWAPSASYLSHVFLPVLARAGLQAQIELVQWGFYPAGGGEIQVQIEGKGTMLHPIQLTDRGELRRVWGTAAVMNLPAHIPQRMAARACNVLEEAGIRAQVEPRRLRGAGPGAGIFLFAEYESAEGCISAGFSAYGHKGLPAEHVAEAACNELLAHQRSGDPVDPHLADQLILPMLTARGTSQITTSRISRHLLTNAWVSRQFLSQDLDITEKRGAAGTIVAKGAEHD
ncbi:MAG: RNA 3'-phosphate cyclase [Anaerolineae bacterium]|nr:RNA 3'-phosphate cyclase [Anaerolineae bacterium]